MNRRAGGHLRGDLVNQTVSNIEDILRAIDSSTVRNYKSYFRRKTTTSPDWKDTNHDDTVVKKNKVINISILNNSKEANDDENRLDYGLMNFGAAGEGNRERNDSEDARFKKDENKKTLSDQIAEGKYGLIEKELFSKTPKAPGIVSYKTNSETPNDNEKTLGGLSKDEIWLAEDHLLVLKGGVANERKKNANENDWVPIDNYEAPKRPVKIPLNPRVPPPFPVQLTEDGPIQFVGKNQFSLFNPFTNETGLFANVNGHISPYLPSSNGDNKKDFASGLGAVKNTSKDSIQDVITPPSWFHNNYKDVDLLKHFPFNLPLPDQTLNKTEDFDEDDPSLFYPPPYSFVYKTNYTNLVGPLVPGIILPPPPDFFSVYEEEKNPIKTPLDAYKRIKEIQLKNRLSASTPLPPTKASTSGYIRDFTRKPKLPSTVITSTKLVKAKTTKIPVPPTILFSTPSPDLLKFKTNHFETTTLKLHPVYVPTSKLYTSTFSTTTPMPPTQQVKQYQKDYGTQAHPIYFEYFDARTTNPFNNPSTTTANSPINNFNQQRTQKKPKQFYLPQFISSTLSPANIDTKYLFVTPKPDIFGAIMSTESPSYNYNTAIPVQKPLVLKPVGKYEDEIAAIKQTLDYYKSGSNGKKPTKPQKVKAVYEFSFEASKHKNQENFKPMISYDQNNNLYAKKPDVKYSHIEELINTNGYFPTTQEPTIKYYRTKQAATLPPKKNIQSYEDSPMMYGQKLNYHVRPFLKEYVTTPQQSQPQKIIVYPSHETMNHGYRINSKNVKYSNQQNYGPASEIASLLNDTLVNYKQPQRPINPLSENIDVQRYPSHRPSIQNNPQQFYPQQPPFYHPPPPPVYSQQRPFHHYHNQQQQHHSADYVKYSYPIISQINPESVHITFYNKPMEKSNENF